MKPTLGVLISALLLCAAGHGADPVDTKRTIDVFNRGHLIHTFEKSQKAKVLAIGLTERIGFTGLYVFDRHGNCVSWDDSTSSGVLEDLAVEFSAEAGPYAVEIVNLGLLPNNFQITIK